MKINNLLWINQRRWGNFRAGDDLVITADAFVADECALTYHTLRNARHALWCAGHDLRTFTLRSIAEGTTKTFGFHSGNHGRLLQTSEISDLRFEICHRATRDAR